MCVCTPGTQQTSFWWVDTILGKQILQNEGVIWTFFGAWHIFHHHKKTKGSLKKPRSETTNIPLAICFSKQPSGRLTLAASALPEMIGMPQKELLGGGLFARTPLCGATPVLTWWCFSKNACKIRNWEGYGRWFWLHLRYAVWPKNTAWNHWFTGIHVGIIDPALNSVMQPSEPWRKIRWKSTKTSHSKHLSKKKFPLKKRKIRALFEVNIFFLRFLSLTEVMAGLGPWDSGKLGTETIHARRKTSLPNIPPNTVVFCFPRPMWSFFFKGDLDTHTHMHICQINLYIYIFT